MCNNNNAFVKHVMNKIACNYSNIYYKAHPKNSTNNNDVSIINKNFPKVEIINSNVNVIDALTNKPDVAVMTSGVGLEAAIRGCIVHCFGLSFYSNWGFTTDYVECDRRINTLTADDVLAHIIFNESVYFDEEKHIINLG